MILNNRNIQFYYPSIVKFLLNNDEIYVTLLLLQFCAEFLNLIASQRSFLSEAKKTKRRRS